MNDLRERERERDIPSNADVFRLTLPADEDAILLQLQLGRVIVDTGGPAR